MSTEKITQQTFEYYAERVQKAPKIGPEEGREADSGQFGNNFYLLFIARKRLLENPEKSDDVLVRIYLRRAEEYGDNWLNFIKENEVLLQKIDEILSGSLKEYSEISGFGLDLLHAKLYGEYDRLDEVVGHPLGLDAIRIEVWKKLNPLLINASLEMQKSGIPPEKFFG